MEKHFSLQEFKCTNPKRKSLNYELEMHTAKQPRKSIYKYRHLHKSWTRLLIWKIENEAIRMCTCGCASALPVLSNYPTATLWQYSCKLNDLKRSATYMSKQLYYNHLCFLYALHAQTCAIPTDSHSAPKCVAPYFTHSPTLSREWSGSYWNRLSGHCFIRSGSCVHGQS